MYSRVLVGCAVRRPRFNARALNVKDDPPYPDQSLENTRIHVRVRSTNRTARLEKALMD